MGDHEMQSAMTTPFDRAVEALAHPARRSILRSLYTKQAIRMIGNDASSAESIEMELVHNHLPKLQSLGFIEYESDTGDVRPGENWDEIEPLLELMEEHKDDLPDGYF